MSKNEQSLFEQYEKNTNHRQLLALTERIAKSGWLVMAIAIGFFVFVGETTIAYAFLVGGLALLASSFVLGIQADRVRKQIQGEVNKQLGKS